MTYFRAYCQFLFKCLGYVGAAFMWTLAWGGDPLAMYLCFTSLIVAFSGPVARFINKKESE
jgi:hypothetical protein